MRLALLPVLLVSFVHAAADEVEELVGRLGDDSWAVRESATRRLLEIGLPARGEVERAGSSGDLEVARRAIAIARAIEARLAGACDARGLLEQARECARELDSLGVAVPPVRGATVERIEGGDVELVLDGPAPRRAGAAIDLHRYGRYVGRVVVASVAGPRATARVDVGWTVEPIRAGDREALSVEESARVVSALAVAVESIDRLRAMAGELPGDVRVPAPFDGRVVAVHVDLGLVMVNLGTKHGVEEGMNFTVYRGDELVGRVVVEEIFPDVASARIDPHFGRKEVVEGDDVTTRTR